MSPVDQAMMGESLKEETQPLLAFNGSNKTVHNFCRNPFLIIEVIENLFPYMDFQSQLASRLVCKLWNQVSTPIMRPTSHLSLQRSARDPYDIFSKTLETSSVLPISKLTLVLSGMGGSVEVLKFLDNHGRDINELTLFANITWIGQVFVDFLNLILSRLCPNLKHLTLMNLHLICFRKIDLKSKAIMNLTSLKVNLIETYLYSNPHNTVEFLQHLVSRAPKLEKITTDFKYSRQLFIRFYRNLTDTGIYPNLTELDLNHAILSNSHLELLNDITFPKLKVLRIDSLVGSSVGQSLIKFLTSVSSSLEKLVLDGDVGNQKWIFKLQERNEAGLKMTFPLMKKLKCFENRNVEGFQVGSIEFLKQLPNLVELLLEDFGEWTISNVIPWRDLFPGRMMHSSDDKSPRITFKSIRKLNMKTILRTESQSLISLKIMFYTFPLLEEFKTLVSLENDCEGFGEFLSILSASEIKGLTLEFRDCSELLKKTAVANFVEAIKATLPSFKRLQRLELKLLDVPRITGKDSILSTDDVAQAFNKVNNLTALALIGFEFGPIEEEKVMQALSSKLSYLVVRDDDTSDF